MQAACFACRRARRHFPRATTRPAAHPALPSQCRSFSKARSTCKTPLVGRHGLLGSRFSVTHSPGANSKQMRRNESARRLGTYPYEAGIKFMLQPQNNARVNSRFFAYLFLSRSGLKGAEVVYRRCIDEFFSDCY